MSIYCAFLRGVNIGGKTMKMAEACHALQNAGLTGVVSVLATGNLVFQSNEPQALLRGLAEDALSRHYREKVSLLIKSKPEADPILLSSPFEDHPDLHIYAFVCEPGFEETLTDAFRGIIPTEGGAAMVQNGLFYWQCRKGATLDSGFSKILGRKDMKDKFTSRNIRTIAKVAARMK